MLFLHVHVVVAIVVRIHSIGTRLTNRRQGNRGKILLL
jgi:hypothetical protein